MVNWYNFFLNLLDNLYSGLYVRHDFWYFLVTYHFNNFLFDHRNGDYLFSFYHFFHDFLYNNLELFRYLFFSFDIPYYFLDDFDRFYLFLYHNFLYLDHNRFFHFDYPLHLNFLRL